MRRIPKLWLVLFFLLALVIGVSLRQIPLWAGGDRPLQPKTGFAQPFQTLPLTAFSDRLLTGNPLALAIDPDRLKNQAPPTVNSDKLMTHVSALAFRRFTTDDRARARTYLTQTLQQLGWQVTQQPVQGGSNLLAEKPGIDPTAGKILVGAHYDTVEISPGADDNATGLAVLLELARLFQQRPTLRTLQLAFFDQEEVGLLGSLAFTNNPTNLHNLQGAIILDMLGYACHTLGCQRYPEGMPISPPTDRGDFLAVIGDQDHLNLLNAFRPKTTTKSRWLGVLQPKFYPTQANTPAIIALLVPLKGLLTPDLLRSDHAPFWYKQIGAVLLTDTANFRSSHYHQASDTLATIDLAFFTRSAQLVTNATAHLLNSPRSSI